ncbi:MAG: restriction endonuclease subunit S [Paludibacteraceae bacterium]|nr:restriction endonuclease subunit S [Paludibacteraceae bacterium]
MKLCKLNKIFNIQSGNGLELISLTRSTTGVNFVARGMKDNGVSAKVKPILGIDPFPAGCLTVAASGSVMESFLQPAPFYTAYHVFVLTPIDKTMSDAVKLYYCMCLRKNKFKYSYGRQANETLPYLMVPELSEVPEYIKSMSLQDLKKQLVDSVYIEGWDDIATQEGIITDTDMLSNIFYMYNGLSSDQVMRSNVKLSDNWIPYIRPSYRQETSVDAYVNKTLIPENKVFPTGTLYVSTDGQGSHTYAYVSIAEFVPNSNVCVLIPKREMCLKEKLFYAMCITRNRFKFSYGRKPKGDKLGSIRLPRYISKVFNELNLDDAFDREMPKRR